MSSLTDKLREAKKRKKEMNATGEDGAVTDQVPNVDRKGKPIGKKPKKKKPIKTDIKETEFGKRYGQPRGLAASRAEGQMVKAGYKNKKKKKK